MRDRRCKVTGVLSIPNSPLATDDMHVSRSMQRTINADIVVVPIEDFGLLLQLWRRIMEADNKLTPVRGRSRTLRPV